MSSIAAVTSFHSHTLSNIYCLQTFCWWLFWLMWNYLIVVLICVFLIISDAENLFMCFSAISRHSLEKHLFNFSIYFWLGCFVFWHWDRWAVCREWRLMSCQLLNIFSHSEGCIPVLFMISFAVQKKTIIQKDICTPNVYCKAINNSQDMEAT